MSSKKKTTPPPTHYAVLDLPPSSTPEQLHERFKLLAVQYHPDKNPAGLAMFQTITAAWMVLKDAAARKRYDAELALLGRKCNACNGRGTTTRSKSFTRSEEVPCLACNATGQI